MYGKSDKPRLGLVLLGCNRFFDLGEGTGNGSYPERGEKRAKWIYDRLKDDFNVTYTNIIYGSDDIINAMAAFDRDRVDFVVALFLSWTQDFAWNRFLRDMREIPILYVHPVDKEVTFGDTHNEDDFTAFLCHTGLVGSLEASGDNRRYSRKMFFEAVGEWEEIFTRIKTFGYASRVRTILRNSHFGLIDCYNEVMWSTYVDPYAMFMKAGPELHFLSIATLKDIISTVSNEKVNEVVNRLCEKYEVLLGVDKGKLLESVRATIGLELLASNNNLDLLILNDVDHVLLEQIGLRPGFYPLNPNTKKPLMVPEGDIGSGLALYTLALLSGKHVNYFEPFYIDPDKNYFVVGHAGPNDYTDPRGKMKISRDVRFEKSPYKHAGAPFAWYVFPPGIKTILHCSQRNGSFQFVAGKVEALPCEHFVASYSHGLLRPVGKSCTELARILIEIGVTQHFTLVDGDYIQQIRDLARMLDFDFFEV
jgi:L-arabinose isomerase